jgi:hypothetical protein
MAEEKTSIIFLGEIDFVRPQKFKIGKILSNFFLSNATVKYIYLVNCHYQCIKLFQMQSCYIDQTILNYFLKIFLPLISFYSCLLSCSSVDPPSNASLQTPCVPIPSHPSIHPNPTHLLSRLTSPHSCSLPPAPMIYGALLRSFISIRHVSIPIQSPFPTEQSPSICYFF